MATIRELRRRINAIKSTQKITRAMQMVAAAKLRRAQENILKARPYAIQLDTIIAQVAMRTKRDMHPLLEDRTGDDRRLLVLVTADAGLCGAFNANMMRSATQYLRENSGREVDLFCIGRKGRDFFRKTDVNMIGDKVMFFNHLKYADAVDVTSRICSLFLEKGYDRVDILYNEFKSAIQHLQRVRQLLPLVPAEPEEGVHTIDYLYEPGEYEVFDKLIPFHLEVQVWRILLESLAAEMGAKMTAMDSATENASELLNTLSITYNRARQALITKELLEIVGGAEAMLG